VYDFKENTTVVFVNKKRRVSIKEYSDAIITLIKGPTRDSQNRLRSPVPKREEP
jgi:hypothetical protein